MTKHRTYYTLIEREADGVWRDVFGAYELDAVHSEREDRRDHDVKAKHLKVISTDGSSAALLAKLDELNAG